MIFALRRALLWWPAAAADDRRKSTRGGDILADAANSSAQKKATQSIFEPLQHGVFQRIWLASLGSSFGALIQGVGAAWAMTQLSGSAENVALVQTAAFTP